MLETELKAAQQELASMRLNQNSSADALSQRVTKLELEKTTIEKRMKQLEQDLYKANKEKKEALQERDNTTNEALRIKKLKDDAEKAL